MKSIRYSVLFAILALASFAAERLASAEPPAETPAAEKLPADTPLVDGKIRQLMQDSNYPGAIEAIDKELAKKDAPKDYLTYLKGRALYLQKQYDKAVSVFDSLQKKFPESTWCRRARFGKAVALARKGDFRAAELIYRSEAEYLLSTERKQEIADIYLEFADTYFKPPKDEQEPDYNKALQFYNKALEVGPKPEKRIEVELLVAQCYHNVRNLPEAAKRYEKFIKDNPDSELDIEARFRLGQCRLAEGNQKLARRVWQDMLAKHIDSKSERIAEATFNLSRTWSIPKPGNDEQLNLGTAALNAFIKRFPDHKLAAKAHVEIASSFTHRGRYEDAVDSLKRFLDDKRYAERDEVPDARNLLGRCYQLQRKYSEALATWRDYLSKHPAHKQWSSVQREIINTEYLMALEKTQAEDYDAAEKLFGEFLAKYPLDNRNPAILLLVNRKYTEAKKWDEAIANWRRLVSKYPGTNEASMAQLLIARTMEKELGKLEEALDEYRKVTWGGSASTAQRARHTLVSKAMTVATERPFRGDETPKLKLTTRNIESVTVRAYKVDMETYFRKMHLAGGVESLDISLIDPDSTFEFKVPKYAKYARLESEIEIPLPDDLKAGVMAVTVSSKTLETTTLVIQSDLDIVVKSSRDEVFVFAENMLSGKPAADVRLLISDGKKVFAEETTGPDGVLQKSFEELKKANDVRVFAMKDGNMASNVVSLSGVGVAIGLADKGYIYTDRPAYKAGQMVHVRGCLRHAVDDKYTIEKDKKYTVEVFDGRNRLLRQEEISLNPFGSFHTHFVLPPTSPQGSYRVLVRDTQGKQNYQGTFLVHAYKLEPMHVTIDTPRKVYYRGEEIEGTIKAAYYYGAPLAGREVRYQLAGERMHTATTDEKGEVKFKLPTREFGQSQLLTMQVTLPERNLRTAANFMLATQGFSVSLKTVRPVYVAGETFEITVNANDAEGSPVGRKLTLKVLERTKVRGKNGERLVEKHEIETDEKDGTARATLKLEDGGQYLIRAEGIDRFDNPISGQYALRISDDKDNVRLRILADRHTFKVGDKAEINLHWREKPALALVTFQGARVLDYKLIELKKGVNKLDIPMTAALAPNFDLAVAIMTDPRGTKRDDKPIRRFHQASSPFSVERDLRVKIATKRADGANGPARPGEEVEVTVTTTDPQGKPVSAELSLAMVEQALLERFSPQIGSIEDFFRGTRRQSAVRTTSSVTFAYRPTTRRINPNLLAERDRLELAREEEDSRRLAGLSVAVGETAVRAGINSINFAGEDIALAALDDGEEVLLSVDEITVANGSSAMTSYGGMTMNAPARASQQMGRSYNRQRGGGMGGGVQLSAGHAVNGRLMFGSGVNGKPGQMGSIVGDGQNFVANGGFYYAAPDASNLTVLANHIDSSIQVMMEDGTVEFLNVNGGGDLGTHEIEALSRRLTDAGAVLLPGMSRQETAYWNPSITTDEKGLATLKITMPEKSTAWKLLAKGLTTETLAGEADGKLVVKKDLFGQLKLPTAFTDGDKAAVVASIHNDAIEKGALSVTLKTTVAGRTVEEKKTIEVDSKGIKELVFKVSLDRPEKPDEKQTGKATPRIAAAFELIISAAGKKDVLRRSVPLLPDGMPVYATASGSASSDTTAWVEASKEMPIESPSMQIIIGPTVERSLLDVVLGSAPSCQLETSSFTTGMESAAADLLASLGLQQLLSKTRDAGSPEAEALDGRIRAGIGLIVSAQNDDGGFSWTGRGGTSGRYGSSQVVWALSKAKKAGYNVPDDTYNKALGYLRKQVAATANDAYESKAILLHALSTAGRGDFALANRLHRVRTSLSASALAHLALAFVEMDRKQTAAELLDVLGQRNLDETLSRRKLARGCLPWSHSPSELRALYALALQEVTPASPKAKEQIDWLLAHRVGHRWAPDKATGPAAMALCRWFASSRFEGKKYKLTVFVNDKQAEQIEIDATSGTRVVNVPDKLLGKGKQRVNFQIEGRGRYTYQCILGGFVPSDKLKSTTSDWRIKRTYEPAPLEVDGREIARGFGVLRGGYSTFKNPLTQLPVGRRGLVELEIYRPYNSSTPQQHFEYLVVTEPIPSGTTVIEKSVTGPFERFEIGPGAITFYIGSRRSIGRIHYQLHGYLPGQYRAGPTVVRNAHRPEQLTVAGSKSLAVLPKGQKSVDKYRLTPQELYELGKIDFGKKQMATAGGHLTELLEKWNLNAAVYKHTVTMLLDVHLQTGPAAKVVHYFEIIKEKWPAEEIPFDKIVKVGAAYHEMGEYERSYLVFRATVEGSFNRESGVAGFLQGQGEFARSIGVMGNLLREYPPESYVAAANYALAQRVYAKAPEAAADARLRKAKINRVDLIRRAWSMLESFMTAYPADPAADQAAFSAANALLELTAYKEAAEACDRYAKRYPKSDLLDSYWYMIGYCHFATSEHKAALEMCRKVAEHLRKDEKTGRTTESSNKWRAIYILGQVHHSLGEAAAAIKEYRRVEDRFADAKQSIEYFTRKNIELPEVTTVKPNEKAEVELKFRNIATCDAKVYRIDLMKFSLLKRNLGGITGINLAGIRPYHEETIKLGDGKDYKDCTRKLALPLKEEGAYLVVCRGENLHASGLVLVTPLGIEVQEDSVSGRVRTTVKDLAADKYLRDVHVKVIGSSNSEFKSGSTDLRGVFVADKIRGTSTVIAQTDKSRYAFFRGETYLGKAPEQATPQSSPKADAPANGADLLKDLKGKNYKFQQEQGKQLQDMYDSDQQGVEAQKVF